MNGRKLLLPTGRAIQEVKTFAAAKKIHRDIKWNHIAMLPTIDEATGDIEHKTLISIDLASVTSCDTEEEALTDMSEQFTSELKIVM